MSTVPTTLRCSPLAAEHATGALRFVQVEQMAMPRAFASGLSAHAPVTLCDVSHRRRFGCKGPQAARWLTERGLAVAAQFNHFTERAGLLVARLAATEFFLECAGSTWAHAAGIEAELAQRVADGGSGVYPVLRADAAIELAGPRADELLAQTCNVNFRPLAAAAQADTGPLVMTALAGVSVLVVPQRRAAELVYRLWCDPTFGPYLWRTLQGIAEELGGGVVPCVATELEEP